MPITEAHKKQVLSQINKNDEFLENDRKFLISAYSSRDKLKILVEDIDSDFFEALELVQATETSREDLHRLVDYVYDRPMGDVRQEVGGVVVTLLGLAANLNLNVPEAFHTEFKRILDPAMIEKMKTKQKAKAEQGVGASYP